MERGLSILWIDAICGSVQNSMTPPEKNMPRRVGKPTLGLNQPSQAPATPYFFNGIGQIPPLAGPCADGKASFRPFAERRSNREVLPLARVTS
jgi:hypothetical protein